jgi:hypothetical protein
VEALEKRCDLLGSSIVNAIKGKDAKPLSEDLKGSIGRLVVYVFSFGYLFQHSSNILATVGYGTLWKPQLGRSQQDWQHMCWWRMTLRFSRMQTRN